VPEPKAADWFHCQKVYQAMANESKLVELDGEEKQAVYEGFLTALVTKKLSLSTPYYTKITSLLKAMGCIRQLRRGGGNSPSQWLLVKAPDQEDFERVLQSGVTHLNPKDAQTEQRLGDHERRIKVLEEALQGVINDADS
jgi:hypothetical protein